jgi:uncharacterized RDD family membrane protein YckC
VAERVVTEALRNENGRIEELVEALVANPAFERMVHDALDSKVTSELTNRVVQSPTFGHALESVLASPQTRAALSRQSTTLAGEVADGLRSRAVRIDDGVERPPRRWFRRAPRPAHEVAGATPYGGIATRGAALCADALLVALLLLVGGGLVALVASLVGELHRGWLAGGLLGGAWLLVEAVYFVGFWTTAGQTPGMRMMRLRVVDGAGAPPGAGRSLVRFIGLLLAIIPLFAGFLPVLVDDRRRALQDFLAGTVVLYDDPLASSQLGDGSGRSQA